MTKWQRCLFEVGRKQKKAGEAFAYRCRRVVVRRRLACGVCQVEGILLIRKRID